MENRLIISIAAIFASASALFAAEAAPAASSIASIRRTECCMAQSGSKVTNVSPFLAMTVRYPAGKVW